MKKYLICIFIALIIAKILLASFITVPLGFSDSLTQITGAKVFFNHPSLENSIFTGKYTFYLIMIAPFFFLQDMNIVFLGIYILNAILSASVIFPTYLLAREFLDKKKSAAIATIVVLLPPIITAGFYILSENLLFPLLLWTSYFIFKASKKNQIVWDILAGVFLTICFLTKKNAIFLLLPLIFICLFLLLKKDWKILRNKIFLVLTSMVLYLPWYLAGATIAGKYSTEAQKALGFLHIEAKIIWILIYTSYIILAGGIILAILFGIALWNFNKKTKEEKILLLLTLGSIIAVILIAANTNSYYENVEDSRLIGRYVDLALPLLIITGFVFMERERIKKAFLYGTGILFLCTLPLLFNTTPFPLNNASLTHVGLFIYELENLGLPSIWITIGISIFAIVFFSFIKRIPFKKWTTIFLLYFLGISILATAIVMYDSNERWGSLEVVQLGQWINKNLDQNASFLIDKDDNPAIIDYRYRSTDPLLYKDRPSLVIAYWIHGDFVLGNITEGSKYNFIITTKELDLPLVKSGENIHIYRSS